MRRRLLAFLLATLFAGVFGVGTARATTSWNQGDSERYTQGTIAANGASIVHAPSGNSLLTVQVTGTWSGTLAVQANVDCSSWKTIYVTSATTSGATPQSSINGNDIYTGSAAGFCQVQVVATGWTSGTANVTIHSGPGGSVSLGGAAGSGGTGTGGTAPWGRQYITGGVADTSIWTTGTGHFITGVMNLASSAQPNTLTCTIYDASSVGQETNANTIYTLVGIAAGQIITFSAAGLTLTNGLRVNCTGSGTLSGAGLALLAN